MKKMLFVLLMLPVICFAAKTTQSSQWEQIRSPNGEYIYRLSVPHGWIVYTSIGGISSPSTIYVPDESHEWFVEK